MSTAEPVASQNDPELARRRALMVATLGFAELPRVPADMVPAFQALHGWLGSWRGIGDVVRGMERQGHDLQLKRFDGEGWRATFYTSGKEHSLTSTTGTAWEKTADLAVQRAAARTLDRVAAADGGGRG